MEVNNNLPEAFIISESKLNTQTVDKVIKMVNDKDWSNVWKKRNMNETPSDVEKLPEIVSEITNIQANATDKTTEYNKKICTHDISHLFEHTHVTVAFLNVTRDFIFGLRELKGIISVSDLPTENVSFWVPPCVLENNDTAIEYGKIITDTVKVSDKLWNTVSKTSSDHPLKVKQAIEHLLPQCHGSHAIATANMFAWKELCMRYGQFWAGDEQRFVFLNLVRSFKMRYPSLFYDIVVEDAQGNQLGIDSILATPYAWKSFKLSLKKETPPVAKPVTRQ